MLSHNALCQGLFGGQLLGVRSATCLSFYTWDTLVLVRRIMIVPTKVWWSESGELVAICTNDSFFILRFDRTTMESAFEDCAEMGEDGIEEAFEVCSSAFVSCSYTVLHSCSLTEKYSLTV